jgi:hypothetical protein
VRPLVAAAVRATRVVDVLVPACALERRHRSVELRLDTPLVGVPPSAPLGDLLNRLFAGVLDPLRACQEIAKLTRAIDAPETE